MEIKKTKSQLKRELTKAQDLYEWSLQQAANRFMGLLPQGHIDQLDKYNFDWNHWENELEKLGFDWNANNPDGIRIKDIKN